MATFSKFNNFVVQLSSKTHDLTSDQLMVYLTNSTPNAATQATKTDLVGIVEEHGYAPADITRTFSATGGVATIGATSVLFIATGGSFGPFRYAVIYNNTTTNKNLIGYVDYGSTITVSVAETFQVAFGASLMTITT